MVMSLSEISCSESGQRYGDFTIVLMFESSDRPFHVNEHGFVTVYMTSTILEKNLRVYVHAGAHL
jgi:hypothetical protein